MKKLILLICTMVFFAAVTANNNTKSTMHRTVEDTIHLYASSELFEVASNWASAFEDYNQETMVNLSSVSLEELHKIINQPDHIALITSDQIPELDIWRMTVGRDVIVPVMNSENPFKNELINRGISPQNFANIYQGEIKTYNHLTESNLSVPIQFYCTSGLTNNKQLAQFMGIEQNVLSESNYLDITSFLQRINNDRNAIGFCKLSDIVDLENHSIKEGISLLPIDKNNNHKIDFAEDIYNKLTDLERGIWIGKYPQALYTNIQVVSNIQPTSDKHLSYLNWLMTEGQHSISADGYCDLISSEQQSNIQKLYELPVEINQSSEANEKYALIFLAIFIATLILLPFLVFVFRKSKQAISDQVIEGKSILLNKETVSVPNGLFFDKSHTWAFMEKDGNVRIGVADFLQHVTGKITKIDMKKPGDFVKKGEPFVTLIQQGKRLIIPSPISGTIRKANDTLNQNTSYVNSAPYTEGWIYLIDSENWLTEIKSYFMGKSYQEWLNKEFVRLKDFFASVMKININNDLEVVMQDGGELNDHPLESLGPIIWEEFQNVFIDRKK